MAGNNYMKHWGWWQYLLLGLIFLAFTAYLFQTFVDFESSRDRSRSMPSLIAALYNAGGKYWACVPSALVGIYLVCVGVAKKFGLFTPKQ